ncbi:phosphoribosylformylglycinamidine cyclo-ligase [Candidatus Woesearchaeota archaeon]|nr:phosphoribosylformylglycinamidine cyclo-ligase [Candidatus Woesearchaeota archaeon]
MNPDYQKRESIAVAAIKRAIPPHLKRDMAESSKGMFCELYSNHLFPTHYCACATDGVGTKLIIASAMEKFDTIGIDLVAMNANDLATIGQVSPFLFMNYFAAQEKMHEFAGDVIKGIVRGLEQCEASEIINSNIHVNMGKGETASVDELLGGIREGTGFDVAGCMIGFIEKKKVPTAVNIGDSIIAFPSSGFHSNGYTDLRLSLLKGNFEERPIFRKRYRGRFSLEDDFEGKSIGEWLLEPTRIYIKEMAKISSKCSVMGINNTGYGLKNFNRIRQNVEFLIDDPIKPHPIFSLVQKEAKLSDEEMYQRFNMGMGFFAICTPDDCEYALKAVKGSKVVGKVRKSQATRTVLDIGKKIVFEGY